MNRCIDLVLPQLKRFGRVVLVDVRLLDFRIYTQESVGHRAYYDLHVIGRQACPDGTLTLVF